MKNLELLNEEEFGKLIDDALDNMCMDMKDVHRDVISEHVKSTAYYDGKYYPQTQWEPAEYPELVYDYDTYTEMVTQFIWESMNNNDEIDRLQLEKQLNAYGYLLDEYEVCEELEEMMEDERYDYYED